MVGRDLPDRLLGASVMCLALAMLFFDSVPLRVIFLVLAILTAAASIK